MSVKTRITIAILLLFIPVVLGVVHRIYHHGKDSFVVFGKRKNKPKDDIFRNKYEATPYEPVKEEAIQEIKTPEHIKKEVKNAPPHFAGGNEALMRYIKSEVVYPENQTVQGVVFVKMRIDEKGNPFDIAVTKSLGKDFDMEAVRVIENMPAWEPQIKNYQVVESDFITVEVPFQKPLRIKTK